MNEKFLEVGDVMQILGISRSAAYKLMRQINSELEKKGYIVKNPNSFTEQLQLRTQTRMMAEEIVIMDVVMQFH